MIQLPLPSVDKVAATPISPLVISDRLISLAEQAGQVGCKATARHLIRLASRVLEERTSLPPIPTRSPG